MYTRIKIAIAEWVEKYLFEIAVLMCLSAVVLQIWGMFFSDEPPIVLLLSSTALLFAELICAGEINVEKLKEMQK